MIIRDNSAALVDGKSGSLGKLAVGTHTNRQYDKLRCHLCSALQRDGNGASVVGKALHSIRKIELHTVVAYIFVKELRHFVIERSHHLIGGFYE